MIFHKEGPTSVGGILVKYAGAAQSAWECACTTFHKEGPTSVGGILVKHAVKYMVDMAWMR